MHKFNYHIHYQKERPNVTKKTIGRKKPHFVGIKIDQARPRGGSDLLAVRSKGRKRKNRTVIVLHVCARWRTMSLVVSTHLRARNVRFVPPRECLCKW